MKVDMTEQEIDDLRWAARAVGAAGCDYRDLMRADRLRALANRAETPDDAYIADPPSWRNCCELISLPADDPRALGLADIVMCAVRTLLSNAKGEPRCEAHGGRS